MKSMTEFRDLASARLDAFDHTEVEGLRRAAVAVCVTEHGGVLSVLIIKRAYRGRNAGQWALPGGRLDRGETAEQAALRELYEELELRLEPSDIIGRLDDFPAVSGFAIAPIIVAPDGARSPVPNPDEVHSVHHIEFSQLTAEDVVRWAPSPNGKPLLQMALGPRMIIHAPTGAVLWQFREVVLLGQKTRVAQVNQPDWTRF